LVEQCVQLRDNFPETVCRSLSHRAQLPFGVVSPELVFKMPSTQPPAAMFTAMNSQIPY